MYIIRHKETKQRIGRRYSTAGTAKGAFKTAYLMYDKTQKKYLKFSEQDIYEVVKEETPEMVALEEAIKYLDCCVTVLDLSGFAPNLKEDIKKWLVKQK